MTCNRDWNYRISIQVTYKVLYPSFVVARTEQKIVKILLALSQSADRFVPANLSTWGLIPSTQALHLFPRDGLDIGGTWQKQKFLMCRVELLRFRARPLTFSMFWRSVPVEQAILSLYARRSSAAVCPSSRMMGAEDVSWNHASPYSKMWRSWTHPVVWRK